MPRPAPDTVDTMAELRSAIDEIDAELMTLLAERLSFADRAPVLKQREGISAAAPSRARQVLDNVRAKAEVAGFDPDMAEAMWKIMIDGIIAREERVMGKEGRDG
ncbi:chorismate mutase [Marivita hallyeonensis]|uniref:chorismate mutase n=1 Tax=Marivita hallyeonensis TaxID=996342 RepID=A0A1M5NDL1_9RHOB|nr:chorismate mutase [Marivita hallyeonensis]SHG87562.1 isochorismate pyruvate lyase [Marivita hallyeonensis]